MEQGVCKRDNRRERRWKNVLRAIQLLLAAALLIGEVFGFTLAGVYREMGDSYFWQWIAQMVLLGLPVLTVILLLQLPVNRLMLEYDYELQGQAFSCYRLLGSRRKWFFSFDLNTVTVFQDVRQIEEGSPEEALLHRAVIACCNEDAPHLMLVASDDCVIGRKRGRTALVLELTGSFHDAMARELRRVIR